MISQWIYHDVKRDVWQVKQRENDDVKVLKEYKTKGEAYRFCAWGIK